MSIVSASLKPASRATKAAPTTPPAGPDRASDAALRAASLPVRMPPLEVSTASGGAPRAESCSPSRSRYFDTPGRRYASATVVAVRSYSRISGSTSLERTTSIFFAPALTAFATASSWRGSMYECSIATATMSGLHASARSAAAAASSGASARVSPSGSTRPGTATR